MFDILAITAPIYVAIFLGYGLTRWGVFQKSDMRGFGTFVIKVSLPAMLFNALSNTQVKEIFKPSYLAAYALASLATLALALVWSMKRLGPSRSGPKAQILRASDTSQP